MGRYFEEFHVGEKFVTEARTIGECEVVTFAGLSGDFNPLHTNNEFAKTTNFGERIAHGLLGQAVASGLISRMGLFDGTAVAFLGINNWRFSGPILFGDTIRVEFEISHMRETGDPGRGIITRDVKVLNQRDETIQHGEMVIMIKREPRQIA
jgi:acyl dehydratase